MHGGRIAYYVLGEGTVLEPQGLPGDPSRPAGDTAPATTTTPQVSGLKFGRMFKRSRREPPPEDRERMVRKLIQLGLCMNDPATHCGRAADERDEESDIPAGYTYLGQFIAHEITFDSTGDLLQSDLKPENLRTPQLDLDSLYGGENGPRGGRPELYADAARLRVGETLATFSSALSLNQTFKNDLFRGTGKSPKEALIADPRNDENLVLAQTHVAFVHFHNRVVDTLEAAGCPPEQLFERARKDVIRHYQWIVLKDFLPRLVDQDVLDCVLRHGLKWFKVDGEDGLFMPLEFSAAAFRIGHSMVRRSYEWNPYHRTDGDKGRVPSLLDLFMQTGFGVGHADKMKVDGKKKLDDKTKLKSHWIIDWRHFYDFGPLEHVRPVPKRNASAKLDTVFNLRLDTVEDFPHGGLDQMQKAITVRNLLRGFYLGLPTGEEAAEWIGETPLTRRQVASGPHAELLDDPAFWGRTPLWYYILKEAELSGGNRLGRVGSRIVAETLVGLIKKSPYSILRDPGWRPAFGRCALTPSSARFNSTAAAECFEMIDLLHFADVIDPVARHLRRLPSYRHL